MKNFNIYELAWVVLFLVVTMVFIGFLSWGAYSMVKHHAPASYAVLTGFSLWIATVLIQMIFKAVKDEQKR